MLAGAAAAFASRLRPYDLAARYGGEEFVLLLPGSSAGGALAVAERMRKMVAGVTVSGCPDGVTASLGVATWKTGEAADMLVTRADGALYRAKAAGRNRVVVAKNEGQP